MFFKVVYYYTKIVERLAILAIPITDQEVINKTRDWKKNGTTEERGSKSKEPEIEDEKKINEIREDIKTKAASESIITGMTQEIDSAEHVNKCSHCGRDETQGAGAREEG